MRISLVILSILLASFNVQAQDASSVIESLCNEVKESVETMPVFKTDACIGLIGKDMKDCTDTQLQLKVEGELEIPQNLASTTIVKTYLTVDENGDINDLEIETKDAELLQNAKAFLKGLKFIPGQESGKAVCTRFSFPLTFDIDNKQTEVIYKVVEQMPTFVGCEEIVEDRVRRKCANEKMNQFIYSNLNYPSEALKHQTEGRVYVRVIIDKEGHVKNPEIIRGIGHGCEKEVLRVIESMPKWNPGRMRGQAVNVYLTIPIMFRAK